MNHTLLIPRNTDRIISLPEMARLLNRHPKTIWRMWAKECVLPKPIRIKGRTLGWKESVYSAWLAEKGEC